MTNGKRDIAYGRIIFILVGLVLGGVILWFGEPLTGGNFDALRILVMAFSILVGILIAIITAFGEPRDLRDGGWRKASAHRRFKIRNIDRCVILFYVYLVVISLAFASALLNTIASEVAMVRWVERFTLSAGVTALFWSFGLPEAIRGMQKDRLDQEVDRRRNPNEQ